MTHTTHTTEKEPSAVISLMASVLVHSLIFAGVYFAYHQNKPMPKVVSVEASLVSGDDLAGAMADIKKAYAQNQAQAKQQQQATKPTPTKNKALDAYYDDLAQKEKAYQAQMEAYARSLDEQIASDMALQKQAWADADRERMQEVADLENRQRSNDDIARENATALDEARRQRDDAIAQANRANQSQSKNLSDGESLHPDTPTTPTVGRGGAVSGGNSSGNSANSTNRNEIIGALQRHIRSHWTRAGKSQTLRVRLKVDAQGNVLSVDVTGNDADLQEQLEDTIRRASPLTPIIGTNYRDLNFNFNIN